MSYSRVAGLLTGLLPSWLHRLLYPGYLFVDYHKYIHSRKWAKRSRAFREDHPYCDVCEWKRSEHVHHTTYRWLGRERDEDLQALCVKCHNAHHEYKKFVDTHLQAGDKTEPGRASKQTVNRGRLIVRNRTRH